MKRPPKLNISPEDMRAAQELRDALVQVEDLPDDDQWELALELLSDAFLFNVVRANQRKPEQMMNLLGLLSGVAIDELLGEKPTEQLLGVTLYGVIFSCLGELEKRHKHFCDTVLQMPTPFTYDPEQPVLFIPRDPENFSVEQVFAYYRGEE